MTESGSGGESGEGTASAESGDTGEPGSWCVDVHWIEPLLGAAALDLDGKDSGVPTVDLWTATSPWDPVAEAFTTAFRVHRFDGSELSFDYELSRPGSFVAFADIDGDDLTDAVVEPELGAGPHFFRGYATGEWSETAEPMSGYDADVGDRLLDVTGDHAVDLLRPAETTLEIHVGDADGGFTLGGTFEIGVHDGWLGVAPTFDGDLVVAISEICHFLCNPMTEVIVISVALDGTPTERSRAKLGGSIDVLDVLDRDDDGRSDLLVQHYVDGDDPRISWLDADADGAFTETTVLEPDALAAIGDFDLDGAVDVIDELGVHWGSEGGGFLPPEALLGEPLWSYGAEGDFDGDGRQDFYSANVIWSVQPCEGPYDPPAEPPPIPWSECGNGRVEPPEACDGTPDCNDECNFATAVLSTVLFDGEGLWDCGYAVDIAPTGDIYVTGHVLSAANDTELLTLALDEDGDVRWFDTAHARLGISSDVGIGVAVEPGGDLYVAGRVDAELLWLRRYTPDGAIVWTEQAASLETGTADEFVLDDEGLPILVGEAEGHAWIAGYDANGAMRWDDTRAETSDFLAVDLDVDGELVAIGHTGDGQALAAAFDATGAPRWDVVSPYPSDPVIITGGVAPDGLTWVVQHDVFSAEYEWVVRTFEGKGGPAGAFVVDGPRQIFGVAFDPAGDAILVGERDGSAWIGRVHADGELVWAQWWRGELHDAVVDLDGTIVATGCLDDDVLVRRFAP